MLVTYHCSNMKSTKRQSVASKLKRTKLFVFLALITGCSIFVYIYQWDSSFNVYKFHKGDPRLQRDTGSLYITERLQTLSQIGHTTTKVSHETYQTNKSTNRLASLSVSWRRHERGPDPDKSLNETSDKEETKETATNEPEIEVTEESATTTKKQAIVNVETAPTATTKTSRLKLSLQADERIESSIRDIPASAIIEPDMQDVKTSSETARGPGRTDFLKQLMSDDRITDEHKEAIMVDLGLSSKTNDSNKIAIPSLSNSKVVAPSVSTNNKIANSSSQPKEKGEDTLHVKYTDTQRKPQDLAQALNNSLKSEQRLRARVHEMRSKLKSTVREPSALVGVNSLKSLHNKKPHKSPNYIRNHLLEIGRNGKYMNRFNNFDQSVIQSGFAEASNVTSRPDTCTKCFNTKFKILINEPNLCARRVEAILLITSSIANQDARNMIRRTWGAVCKTPNSALLCVFVFGNRNQSYENKMLLKESNVYHDIIQFDFYDAYANLTYKTMTSLQWAAKFCKSAQFVMKTDDDMYINTNLLPDLLKAAPKSRFIGGFCWGQSSPHRDMSSKWYVSFQQYARPYYPQMCSGTGYVMTMDVVRGVISVSTDIPFFYLEDVYIAICIKKIGVQPMAIAGFNNMLADFDPCHYKLDVITSHGLTPFTLKYYWDEVQRATCPPVDRANLFMAHPV